MLALPQGTSRSGDHSPQQRTVNEVRRTHGDGGDGATGRKDRSDESAQTPRMRLRSVTRRSERGGAAPTPCRMRRWVASSSRAHCRTSTGSSTSARWSGRCSPPTCLRATCACAATTSCSSARLTSTAHLPSLPQLTRGSAWRSTARSSIRSRQIWSGASGCRSTTSVGARRPRTPSSPGTSRPSSATTAWWRSASPTRCTRSTTSGSCPIATSSARARTAATNVPTVISARTVPASSSLRT